MNYTDIDSGVAAYIDFMVADYAAYTIRSIGEERAKESIKEFKNSFSVRSGKRYSKIIANGSVKAFVVNTNEDRTFKFGDILKAAGFAAPARNSARGNVLEGKFSGGWTGPAYLK